VYATVSRQGWLIAPHAYTMIEQSGRKTEVGPPPLARSSSEFAAYCSAAQLALVRK